MTRACWLARTAALSLALGLLAPAAAARPSLWTRAREPERAKSERALERLERVFDGIALSDGDVAMTQDFRLGTLAVAEMSGARAFSDPRLSLLLARALIGAELGRDGEARELLLAALARLGPDSAWLEADLRVALAEASSRREPASVVQAVTRALPLVWDPDVRSALFCERAEARMALGLVRASQADAREGLAAARDSSRRLDAQLVLGLALERMGDLPAALELYRRARSSMPAGEEAGGDALELFGFRPQDLFYADGLAAMASAGDPERAPADRRADWLSAISAWQRYEQSAHADDRWLPAARAYRVQAERALVQLQAASGSGR